MSKGWLKEANSDDFLHNLKTESGSEIRLQITSFELKICVVKNQLPVTYMKKDPVMRLRMGVVFS